MALKYDRGNNLILRELSKEEAGVVKEFLFWALHSLNAQEASVIPMTKSPALGKHYQEQLRYISNSQSHVKHLLSCLNNATGV